MLVKNNRNLYHGHVNCKDDSADKDTDATSTHLLQRDYHPRGREDREANHRGALLLFCEYVQYHSCRPRRSLPYSSSSPSFDSPIQERALYSISLWRYITPHTWGFKIWRKYDVIMMVRKTTGWHGSRFIYMGVDMHFLSPRIFCTKKILGVDFRTKPTPRIFFC